MGLGKFTPDGYLTSCGLDYLTDKLISKIFILVYAFAAYFIPLSVIFICYCFIGFELRKRQNIELRAENRNHNVEKRVAKTIFSLIFMWIVSWTPYAILALCSVFGIIKEGITPFVSMWPAVFCKSVSCINPWIYALSNPKFKNELPFCSRNTRNVQTQDNPMTDIKTKDQSCTTKKQNTNTSKICVKSSIKIDDVIKNESVGSEPMTKNANQSIIPTKID